MKELYTVSHEKMREFVSSYDRGQFPEQRFGQAFCNHFMLVWPQVFYETSRKKAEEVIYSTIVK